MKTNQSLFVILAHPQKQVAQGTCYITQDVSTTMMSSKAARFSSFAEAKEFAKENHIALTALTYFIGLKDFIDLDLHG